MRRRSRVTALIAGFSCALMVVVTTVFSTSAAIASPTPASLVPSTIRSSGQLSIGSDMTVAPYDYLSGGKADGIDASMCGGVASVLGLKQHWDNGQFGGLIVALEAKKFDVICSGMYITPVRSKAINFVPYIRTGISIVTKTGNPDHIKGLSGLCGLTLAVTLGSEEQTVAGQQSKACTKAGKSAINVTTYQEYAEALLNLRDGHADALLGDDPTMAYDVKQNPGTEVAVSGIDTVLNGIGVPKSDPGLLNAVSAALKKMKADGAYEAALKKWGITADAVSNFNPVR